MLPLNLQAISLRDYNCSLNKVERRCCDNGILLIVLASRESMIYEWMAVNLH